MNIHKEISPAMDAPNERMVAASVVAPLDDPKAGNFVMKTKVCNKCDRPLPADVIHFHKQKDNKSGFASWCKECCGSSFNMTRKTLIIYNDGSRICRRCMVHYPSQKDYFPVVARNPHGHGAICFECQREVRAKYITYSLHYVKKRCAEDPIYKFIRSVRSSVSSALTGNTKHKKFFELLGCSAEYFRFYMETQFKKGMSWDNYGIKGWHADHIKPIAMFEMSDPKQISECFHYSNYQPLWARENNVKNAKYKGVDYRTKKQK